MTQVIEAFSIVDQTNENTDKDVVLNTENRSVCESGNYCSDIC